MSESEFGRPKIFVQHSSLPLSCGPDCKLYSLKTHSCMYSGKKKDARTACEFGFTEEILKEILPPKTET